MKIDLSCPVERLRNTMPEKQGDECVCLMNNLSEKVVTSVQVTLIGYGSNGELLLHQTERVLGLRAVPAERFTMGFEPERWDDQIESADLIVEKVWFDDATVWRRESVAYVHYSPNALPGGRALDRLRFVAGQDAVGYPQEQEEVWMCVCGRPNSHEARVCCRCHRGKEAVFASFSQENVETLDSIREQALRDHSRKIREENNLLQENRERIAFAQKRRRKTVLRWTTVLLSTAVVVAAFILWGMPALKYVYAGKLLASGNYEPARDIYLSLGEYRNSAGQVNQCDYVRAESLANAGDVESLELAQTAFEQLGDYSDSTERARQTAYSLGENYLTEGYYDLAAGKFGELGDWEDSEDRYLEAVWLQAEAARDSGNYETARLLFENLGDFRDSSAQVVRCSCLLGEKYLAEGSYEYALSELEGLDENEEAAALIKKARYLLAEERFSHEDYEGAGEMYLAAGDYEDALEKGQNSLYIKAGLDRDAGDYAGAMALFDRLENYRDSAGQAMNCRYLLAQSFRNSGDWQAAVDCFGDSASTENMTDEIKAFLADCHYQLAQQALAAGNQDEAEAELDNAVTYGHNPAELKKLRYELAERSFDEGDYESALSRFLSLATYRNSAARVKQCRYALAEAAANAGDYVSAVEYYRVLGNYKESKKRLEEVSYLLAEAYYAAGDPESAVEVLSSMTGSRGKTLLRKILKEEGQKLQDAGSYEAAAGSFRQMGNSEGTALANGALYLRAEELYNQGSYTEAAELFRSLGDYEDAQSRAEASAAAVWGALADIARTAFESKDYASAVAYLEGYDLDKLAQVYPDLPELYREAALREGDRLFAEDRFYEALPYYQRAGDYQDAANEKLRRRVYFLLGDWKSSGGHTASFRVDGTCVLDGVEMVFRTSGFNMFTGPDADSMTATHSLTAVTESGLTLRLKADGSVTKYTREGEWVLPEQEIPSIPLPDSSAQNAGENMLVEEPGDGE